ncbi:MAG: FeoA family protein [Chloroflexota bacterium]
MQCQLCGYEFNPTGMVCHAECPLGSHCNLVCCPNCGYQVVDESKSTLAGLLRRIWPSLGQSNKPPRPRKFDRSGEPLVPLTHVPAGKTVEVCDTGEMPAHRLTKLSIFGLVPGRQVEVLQRRPAPVIRIDETELTLSEDILDQIWVRV